MKNILLFLLFLFLACPLSLRAETTSPKYWISFSNDEGVWVMKIDSAGKIILPARIVIDKKSLGFRAFNTLALSKNGTTRLTIWGVDYDQRQIERLIIDDDTLRLVSIRKSRVHTENRFHGSVTQTAKNNFFLVQKSQDTSSLLYGYAVSSTGRFMGDRWLLSEEPVGLNGCEEPYCHGSVSSDGRVLVLIHRGLPDTPLSQLFFQRLTRSGKPAGTPVLLQELQNCCGGLINPDLTNRLPDGKRFVVYVSAPQDFSSLIPNSVFLQPINSTTGTLIGSRKTLIPESDDLFLDVAIQGLAIDPKGQFVLISARAANLRGLLFLALDESGNRLGHLANNAQPKGKAAWLFLGIAQGIDILKQ